MKLVYVRERTNIAFCISLDYCLLWDNLCWINEGNIVIKDNTHTNTHSVSPVTIQ